MCIFITLQVQAEVAVLSECRFREDDLAFNSDPFWCERGDSPHCTHRAEAAVISNAKYFACKTYYISVLV